MDSNPARNTMVLIVVSVTAAAVIGTLGLAYAQALRKNVELAAEAGELNDRVAALNAAQQGLEKQLTDQKSELAQALAVTESLRQKNDALLHPPLDNPGCVDSDAKYGKDEIYYRGSARSGGGQVSDHCRLGQLVEFSCIENPSGSGILHVDSVIRNCPEGSRCVDGTCLR